MIISVNETIKRGQLSLIIYNIIFSYDKESFTLYEMADILYRYGISLQTDELYDILEYYVDMGFLTKAYNEYIILSKQKGLM